MLNQILTKHLNDTSSRTKTEMISKYHVMGQRMEKKWIKQFFMWKKNNFEDHVAIFINGMIWEKNWNNASLDKLGKYQ